MLSARTSPASAGRELALTADTLVATFDGPARAIRCASTLLDLARSVGRPAARACTPARGGRRRPARGIPVPSPHLKERAEPGEVLVSSTVRDLVAGSGLVFSERESRSRFGSKACRASGASTPSSPDRGKAGAGLNLGRDGVEPGAQARGELAQLLLGDHERGETVQPAAGERTRDRAADVTARDCRATRERGVRLHQRTGSICTAASSAGPVRTSDTSGWSTRLRRSRRAGPPASEPGCRALPAS